MAYPHSRALPESDSELAVLHTLDERPPFTTGEEECFLSRVLGIPHRHALGGDGNRDTPCDDPAVGRLFEVIVLHGKPKSCLHDFALLSLRIGYLSALQL